jgi:cytochrome c oxidase assembly protein subunit 11
MSSTVRSSPANARVGLICAAVAVAMVGAAFAAVPLYRLFCQVTGFDGTVRRASAAPTQVLDRTVTVRFDANVRGLPWSFAPEQVSQDVKIGDTGMAFFSVTNTGSEPLTGTASYNVLPESTGAYFQKLECFCFQAQTLEPGQTIKFPVVYFVDPELAKDRETDRVREITLSYTFFPTGKVQQQARGPAALGDAG